MKLSLPAVILLTGGIVLIYSGTKNISPKDLIISALNGKTPDMTGAGSALGNGVAAGAAVITGASNPVPAPTNKPGTQFVSV